MKLAERTGRPMDILASFGVVYSALLLAWIPDDAAMAMIAWGAAAAWICCGTAFALAGRDLALHWATFCGLVAGGFTQLPLGDPSPAGLFRAFLPLALRRALGLQTSNAWTVALLASVAVLPAAPAWTLVAVALSLLATAVELVVKRWSRSWSRPLAACIALPVAVVVAEIFGVARFDVGTVLFTGGVVAVLIHASIASARTALEGDTA